MIGIDKKVIYNIAFFIICFILLNQQILEAKRGYNMGLELKSIAFGNNQRIPQEYTCQGKGISPPLTWENIPEGTKSFVLINDDPDAPVGTWVHWVIYNIPSNIKQLKEGMSSDGVLEGGILQGVNDFGRTGYGGPCPPPGAVHRYFFKLYAVDIMLELPAAVEKSKVEEAIQGHILADTELIGLYSR